MSERLPSRVSDLVVPADRVRPPWWLITSWLRWGWFGFLYPGMMGFFALQRTHEGKGGTIDTFFVVILFACVAVALVQLVLTLQAYRQDPSLRTREWPSPAPGPGVSRRVWVTITLIAIAAIGLVLLLYAGWQGALFVVAILVGLAVLFVRFDLFADDPPPAGQGRRFDGSDREAPGTDR